MQPRRSPRLAGAMSLTFGTFVIAALVVTYAAQTPPTSQAPAAGGAHHMVSGKAIAWQDPPPSMPQGAKIAVLHGDPGKEGPFTIRLKLPTNFRVPPHWHPSDENLTIIEGTFMLGMGEKFDTAGMKPLVAGDYAFMPKETRHYATSKSDTVIQVNGMGPFMITYVNPEDDPRAKKPTGSKQ
jgi:quercetin dioxygenase-like cupin family protein